MIFILTSIQEYIELFFGVYTELFTVSHKVKEAYPAAITVNILPSSGENSIEQGRNADVILINQSPKDTAKQLVKQVENL